MALVLYAAAAEIFRPAPDANRESSAPSSWKLIVRTVIVTVIAGIVLQTLGAILLAVSGVYNIAADQPHLEPVSWLLRTARSRSVRFHTRPEKIPNFRDAALVKQGFVLTQKYCQPCHGAPGVANELIAAASIPSPQRWWISTPTGPIFNCSGSCLTD